MEQGLRDCCRSIRIGKILIQSDEETQRAKVYYAKFPPDIYRRKVLLMYPILSEWRPQHGQPDSSERQVPALKENFHISGALIGFSAWFR
ncbi:uracil phosphoribosyltransferase homolog [Hirundo rustica]|uniref:uracil phosphoribosyltransferase homolog n=1 Tax=Hirundo rustica TaxID=43150 RepID=UPI001A93AD83|nr:uracil phosphoribosyltransferase homolog [Hirundo rustica]